MSSSDVQLIVHQIRTRHELRDRRQTVAAKRARGVLDLIACDERFGRHRLQIDDTLGSDDLDDLRDRPERKDQRKRRDRPGPDDQALFNRAESRSGGRQHVLAGRHRHKRDASVGICLRLLAPVR